MKREVPEINLPPSQLENSIIKNIALIGPTIQLRCYCNLAISQRPYAWKAEL